MNSRALITIIKGSVLNSLVFKGSLFIKIITVILSEISSIFVMFILLSRFQGYGELTSGQFVFMYFFAHISYSICMLMFNNLRQLGRHIQLGFFDKIMLMPMNTMMYVCSYNFDLASIGQVITSLLLFILFRNSYGIDWNLSNILFLLIILLCSILILSSILMVLSSIAFLTVDWKPLDNMFGAFKEILWYPLSIYNGIVQIILYSFIPLAYIVYVPTHLIFGIDVPVENNLLIVCIYLIVSFILFGCCYKFWYYQSSKYQSAG